MKRLLAAGALGLLMAGGTLTVAQAEPGPNGSNDHGLCTAFFNGQKNGHESGQNAPGPFAALESHSEENAPRNNDQNEENDVSGFEAIFDYCNQSGIGIGGNPDDNGRYTCTPDNPATPDTDEFGCETNPGPGGSDGSNGKGNRPPSS